MKKTIALLLALVLCLSVVGCASEKKPPVTSPNATADSTGATNEPGDAPGDDTKPTEPTEPKEPEGVYLRDAYSVSDEDAAKLRQEVIATAGGKELTNGLLQIYYWTSVYTFLNEQGAYIPYYGLDLSKPLGEQTFVSGEGTWEQFFLNDALTVWHRYQALVLMAEELELPMDPQKQEELDETEKLLQESAEEGGYDSVEAFLADKMGPGCTQEDYMLYSKLFYESYNYYEYMYDQIDVTDADIEAYFNENEEALKEDGVTKETMKYGVRHILIAPKGGTKDDKGNTTYSDAEWEACKTAAQDLLDQWKAGEATEESFAELAKKHTEDPGSKDNGGLYEDLDENTSFVKPFKDWYLDESRQVGDTGLVKSDYGYHIMYMSSAETVWMDYVRQILLYNESAEFVNEALEKYEMVTDYDKIAIGQVELETEEKKED